LQDLGIITLIITDIDAIDPVKNRTSTLPERNKGYLTNNTTLKQWKPAKEPIDELVAVKDDPADTSVIKAVYQMPLKRQLHNDKKVVEVIPYTFEIALAFENIGLFRNLGGNGLIKKFNKAVNLPTVAEANRAMFDALESGKKAEFALELLYLEDPGSLKTPAYISGGLEWLKNKLTKTAQ
jgi:hypothetical protein